MIKQKEKIGYDLDGVLVYEYPESWFKSLMWKLFPNWWSSYIHIHSKGTALQVNPNSFIITGRPTGEWGLTTRQLREMKINATLCINPSLHHPDKFKGALWKMKKINDFEITTFYEDDDDTIELLRRSTKAKIIKVTNGQISK